MEHTLHVVTAISNPVRFASRYRLYRQFARRVEAAGARLYTVELALGHRPFKVTSPHNPRHLQLRTWSELWHKENLLNLGIRHLLPAHWRYVAWIDGDVEFTRPDWVRETLHQLQHYRWVQMFSHGVDLGPSGEPLAVHAGFVWSYLNHRPHGTGYHDWHPGYGWAAWRTAWEECDGLLDRAILGSGDRHMACALLGSVEHSFNSRVHANYKAMCRRWQTRAEHAVEGDVGYVPGTLLHHWHGKKKDRQYVDRWKILVQNHFDPFLDVEYDRHGVLELTGNKPKLRDDLRRYFRSRNEDSIDLF